MLSTVDPLKIIEFFYPDTPLRKLLLLHSTQVCNKALAIAGKSAVELDLEVVRVGAMLHDIGIRWCHAPGIFCEGEEPYIRHGLIGGEILRKEGFPQHARVCERHTGTGLTREQITRQNLPLPEEDFTPETFEEQLVCYADKFFSKSHPDRVLSVADAARSLEKFGHEGVEKFLEWAKKFE